MICCTVPLEHNLVNHYVHQFVQNWYQLNVMVNNFIVGCAVDPLILIKKCKWGLARSADASSPNHTLIPPWYCFKGRRILIAFSICW